MGTRTIVNGWIVADAGDENHNRAVLETYPYDEVYPLRAVFSQPRPAYRGSIIAFADAIKADRGDWREWRSAFEAFLGRLKWREAQLALAETEAPATALYSYVLIERSAAGARAARFELASGTEELGETELVL